MKPASMVVVLAALALSACGEECNDNPSNPPTLRLLDADTGEPVSNAVVTLSGPDEDTQQGEDYEGGLYAFMVFNLGEYTATITAPGYAPATARLNLTHDECRDTLVNGSMDPIDVSLEPAGKELGTKKLPSPVEVGSEVVDPKGRRWRVTKKVDHAIATQALPLDDTIEPTEGVRYMSIPEIAEALRPVSYANGYELTLAQPDLATAALIKQAYDQQALAERGATSQQARPSVQTVVEQDGGNSLSVKRMIGSDKRVLRRDNSTYPLRTNISLSPTQFGTSYDAGSCTATLIGPGTAISSAHCFHDGSWITDAYWSPGVDKQDTWIAPYNPQTTIYPNNNAAGSSTTATESRFRASG